MTRYFRSFLLACAMLATQLAAVPAQAAVTITFWSHEFGNSFPHAFFTLRGRPDAGGAPVDANYGFTARTVSPAILMGSVKGRLDIAKPSYIAGSDAQFAVTLTDAQYAEVMALVAAWDEKTGNARYDLGSRNCIHFVKEAARRSGVTVLDFPKLMKKPRSYLKAVAAANAGQVRLIAQPGSAYLATLPVIPPPTVPTLTPAPAR